MESSFGLIVGESALSSCMSVSTRCSMSGLAGSRVFCGLTCWGASVRLAIPSDHWSWKPREFRTMPWQLADELSPDDFRDFQAQYRKKSRFLVDESLGPEASSRGSQPSLEHGFCWGRWPERQRR